MMIFTKKPKYKNKKIIIDGFVFDSKMEGEYYERLKLLKNLGLVVSFDRQVKYELIPKQKGERGVWYVADFVVHYSDGRTEVVDVKGFKTSDYIIKRKLLKYIHPEWNETRTTFVEITNDRKRVKK